MGSRLGGEHARQFWGRRQRESLSELERGQRIFGLLTPENRICIPVC